MPVHLRLNDKDTSRNPYINFVTALPGPRQDEALRRLQQLAAMVRPLMKDQGFHINSLEEYEHNREFAGRCWNNGEVVELVLTTSDGSWRPLQFVLYVFCHELAHIKHMNHLPHLHGALTRHLKQMALEKQKQGYYGDGLWSSGRQLQDGGFVSGLGMNAAQQDLPENVCGGAFRRARGKRLPGGKRRRDASTLGGRKFKGPSLHTGAQTSSNTRGGNRRVKIGAESSLGNRVDGRDWIPMASAKNKEYKLDENSTFRKRTQSKDAREKRAAAAMARLAALQGTSLAVVKTEPPTSFKLEPKQELDKDFPLDEGSVTESSEESADHDDYDDSSLVGNDLGENCGSRLKEEPEEYHFTQAANTRETADQRKRRMRRFDDRSAGTGLSDNTWKDLFDVDDPFRTNGIEPTTEPATLKKRTPVKAEEVEDKSDEEVVLQSCTSDLSREIKSKGVTAAAKSSVTPSSRAPSEEWSCLLCTLHNPSNLQRCAACDTTRGKSTLGA